MNAEALIGTVLGTCTLQKLIGQGGMGAVFLAQQSRPRRQVAVKVLLPMTPLTPNQLAAFLERFRRETDAAASLEHPNIMPVHEYGERDGLAYLVMPYIGGGTLRDELERDGALAFAKAANYLEQMASALDFAHEHGVVHRDIKPANILLTPEGRLLLADFGLVKIIAEGQGALMRLTGPGAPVGTPDYMAPEQVIGDEVDGRSDLYSLGVMLYQMITGVTPFQGDTPMQIANQHLQLAPPSPRLMRPDLPIGAEHVLLRALAKHPSERYTRGQDLVQAFAVSLLNAGIALSGNTGVVPSITMSGATGTRLYTPRGLFDPSWQSSSIPAVTNALPDRTGLFPAATAINGIFSTANANSALASRTGMFPAMPDAAPPPPTNGKMGLLSRTGMFPAMTNAALPAMPANGSPGIASQIDVQPSVARADVSVPSRGGLFAYTGKFTQVGPLEVGSGIQTVGPENGRTVVTPPGNLLEIPGSALEQPQQPSSSVLEGNTTGSWLVPGQQLGLGTVKLTGPVKVIQVPVAGQPGRYMTGLLPVMAKPQEPEINAEAKKKDQMWVKIIATVVTIMLLLGSAAGLFWYLRIRPTQQVTTAPSVKATAATGSGASGASATPDPKTANVILSDPLKTNIHNWPTTAPDYVFKDGAYHLANHHNGVLAPILQGLTLTGTYTYSLTTQEIAGDDASPNNNFGMIFRFSQQQKGGAKITTFYSFEVVDMKGGEYQFWKYDDSQGTSVSPWKKIWNAPLGDEFHLGHGSQSTNTFKVIVNGDTFTLMMNGKTLAQSVKDGSFTNGMVGLLVNLQGTEVAFSNMLLTRQ